jgi:hypothetical protein
MFSCINIPSQRICRDGAEEGFCREADELTIVPSFELEWPIKIETEIAMSQAKIDNEAEQNFKRIGNRCDYSRGRSFYANGRAEADASV